MYLVRIIGVFTEATVLVPKAVSASAAEALARKLLIVAGYSLAQSEAEVTALRLDAPTLMYARNT